MAFEFTTESAEKAKTAIAKYPNGRQKSAVMDLLYIAQNQNNGWISTDAIQYIADFVQIPATRVHEVATFYTMYNLKPVGKHLIQVCGTTPCMLRGSEEIINVCQKILGIKVGQTTPDGLFTLMEVECLGACSNAPMMQINNWYYEDLTTQQIENIIQLLRDGREITTGSQIGRKSAEPKCLCKQN